MVDHWAKLLAHGCSEQEPGSLDMFDIFFNRMCPTKVGVCGDLPGNYLYFCYFLGVQSYEWYDSIDLLYNLIFVHIFLICEDFFAVPGIGFFTPLKWVTVLIYYPLIVHRSDRNLILSRDHGSKKCSLPTRGHGKTTRLTFVLHLCLAVFIVISCCGHGRSVSKGSLLDSALCKHHSSPGIGNELMTGQATTCFWWFTARPSRWISGYLAIFFNITSI